MQQALRMLWFVLVSLFVLGSLVNYVRTGDRDWLVIALLGVIWQEVAE